MTRDESAFEWHTDLGLPQAALAAGGIAAVTGLFVYLLGHELLPFLSANHDEGVYLQQAELLLAGQLELHAGRIADAVRPWFFVQDGGRLYPRYAPYPAGLYAIAMLLGDPRLALGLTAAVNVFLVYLLGTAAFDRRIGLTAAGLFALSPMALLATAAFLPYAPTTTLTLAFVWLYLRHQRDGRTGTAALAGGAIGLAFFARPFTAVLVAVPVILHAIWQTIASISLDNGIAGQPIVRRQLATGLVGTGFVVATLAYNARMTGDPLVFPFEAFAPLDRIGFGRREILGHTVEYTPGLALQSTLWALWHLAARWVSLGGLGTLLAIVGGGAVVRGWHHRRGAVVANTRRLARVLLLGIVVSVTLGNLLFWGTLNVLGTPWDPADGLVSLFGPFYHFDLLAPSAIFAAVGIATVTASLWRRLEDRVPRVVGTGSTRRRVLVSAVIVAALLGAVLTGGLLAGPLDRHAAYTDRYASAYEPFEEATLEGGIVLLPTPYGPWVNHPFQTLRNDADLEGEPVYAIDGDAAGNFALLDTYPDREPYRLTYRGAWDAADPEPVMPVLEPLVVRSAPAFRGRSTVGVPAGVDHATIRLASGDDKTAPVTIDDPEGSLTIGWGVNGEQAWVRDHEDRAIPLGSTDELVVLVRLVEPAGASITYRQEVDVRRTDDGVEVLWPPDRRVCRLTDDCGREGTYLDDRPAVHLEGVSLETSIRATADSRTEADD